MITLEMLRSTSLRAHLESVYERNPDSGVHRPYWSVAGRPLSLAEADELFEADDEDFLLSKTHFTIISNERPGESKGRARSRACFVTDDHCYGHPILQDRGW